MIIEAAIFLFGAVVGVIIGRRWALKDAAAEVSLSSASPQGGGGPAVPEK